MIPRASASKLGCQVYSPWLIGLCFEVTVGAAGGERGGIQVRLPAQRLGIAGLVAGGGVRGRDPCRVAGPIVRGPTERVGVSQLA
jgi:hypothetical protein